MRRSFIAILCFVFTGCSLEEAFVGRASEPAAEKSTGSQSGEKESGKEGDATESASKTDADAGTGESTATTTSDAPAGGTTTSYVELTVGTPPGQKVQDAFPIQWHVEAKNSSEISGYYFTKTVECKNDVLVNGVWTPLTLAKRDKLIMELLANEPLLLEVVIGGRGDGDFSEFRIPPIHCVVAEGKPPCEQVWITPKGRVSARVAFVAAPPPNTHRCE